MTIAAGSSLAHYRITGELGSGGMGEVWRAEDTKLGREVALKVLPAEFAEDEQRLSRFQREAKVLASLNHPNIAHLYGLETAPPCHSERAKRVEESPEAQSDALGTGSTAATDTDTDRDTDTDTDADSNAGSGANERIVGEGFTPSREGDRAGINPAPTTFLVMELVEGEDGDAS